MNRIVNTILARMSEIEKSLVENPAADFTSYRERLSLYNGLKEALDIILQVEKQDDN